MCWLTCFPSWSFQNGGGILALREHQDEKDWNWVKTEAWERVGVHKKKKCYEHTHNRQTAAVPHRKTAQHQGFQLRPGIQEAIHWAKERERERDSMYSHGHRELSALRKGSHLYVITPKSHTRRAGRIPSKQKYKRQSNCMVFQAYKWTVKLNWNCTYSPRTTVVVIVVGRYPSVVGWTGPNSAA